MKRILYIIVLLGLYFQAHATELYNVHVKSFSQEVGTQNSSWARDIIKKENELFIFGDSGSKTILIKTDLNLNTIWKKEYELDEQYSLIQNVIQAFIPSTNDGFIILGNMQYGADAMSTYIKKVDFEGNEIFSQKFFNMTQSGSREFRATNIAELSNGNFVAVGVYNDVNLSIAYGEEGHEIDGALILTLSPDGEELSRQRFESEYSQNEDFADYYATTYGNSTPLALSNGEYLFSTVTQFQAGSSLPDKTQIYHVNTTGDITLKKEYSHQDLDSSVTSMELLDNGNKLYVNVGYQIFDSEKFFYDMTNMNAWQDVPLQEWNNYLEYERLISSYSSLNHTINFTKYNDNNEIVYDAISFDSNDDFGQFIKIHEGYYIGVGGAQTQAYSYSMAAMKFLDETASKTLKVLQPLSSGWHLLACEEELSSMSIFDGGIVWNWKNGEWKAYSKDSNKITQAQIELLQTLHIGDGFWFKKP